MDQDEIRGGFRSDSKGQRDGGQDQGGKNQEDQ